MSEKIYYPLRAVLHVERNGVKETHVVGVMPVDKEGNLLFSETPVKDQETAITIDSNSPYFNAACEMAGII